MLLLGTPDADGHWAKWNPFPWLTAAGLDAYSEFLEQHDARHSTTYAKEFTTARRKYEKPGGLVGTLKNIEILMLAALKKSPRKWLYQKRNGIFIPFLVREVQYVSRSASDDAHTRIVLECLAPRTDRRDTSDRTGVHGTGIRIEPVDIRGKTLDEVLNSAGWYFETDKIYTGYLADMKLWQEHSTLVGQQVLVSGNWEGLFIRNWFDPITLSVEGEAATAVLDGSVETTDDKGFGAPVPAERATMFWPGSHPLPIIPVVRVFHMVRHEMAEAHIRCISEYPWRGEAAGHLVLKKADKELVTLLASSVGRRMEDIIAGKSNGVFVIASGPPGTGKTLTAQAISEQLQKPLYSVHCSQLGTNPEAVEKRLLTVLRRAKRWGAVLLIDESDVYVRARDNDLQQNALVGVFLRVLENYSGFLIMTTNLGHQIDDAILSRATAHVRYRLPGAEERRMIAAKQAEILGLAVEEEVLDYIEQHEHLSGRDIRNTMKLGVFLVGDSGDVLSLDRYKFCQSYQGPDIKA